MKDHDLCLYYEDCANAAVCLRCLVPLKNSGETGTPCCFRRKK